MKNYNLLKGFYVLAISLFSASAFASPISGENDITFLVGSGSNRANLVLDFHDGKTKQAFAWGYLFDAPVSGAQMLLDIAAADVNLTVNYFGTAADGFYISNLAYADGVETHSYTNFGYYIAGGTANETSIPGGGTTLPSLWTESPTGASTSSLGSPGRNLSDGAWDAWSAGDWTESPPSSGNWVAPPAPSNPVYAAIPEAGTLASLLLAAIALICFVRRTR